MSSEKPPLKTAPIETVDEIDARWPGALTGDITEITRFVFHAAAHFPSGLYNGLNETYRRGYETLDNLSEAARTLLEAVEPGRYRTQGNSSRLTLAQETARMLSYQLDSTATIERLGSSADLDEAVEIARLFISRYPIYKEHNYGRSPLFPEGRSVRIPIEVDEDGLVGKSRWGASVTIETPDGGYDFPDEIADVRKKVFRRKVRDAHAELMSRVEPIDQTEASSLRNTFGAKAANLMLFERAYNMLKADFPYPGELVGIEIPPFAAVSTDLYRSWKGGDVSFREQLESLREQAQGFAQGDPEFGKLPGLVAIRSSAVHSEDGDNLSGAGIYESVTADPFDAEAFEDAIVKVFASTDSPEAIAYRKAHGVETEEMGLIIQRYVESERSNNSTHYGYVNSRANDPRITEYILEEGSLFFDHDKIDSNLLLSAHDEDDRSATQQYLHTVPDHRKEVFREVLRGFRGGATEVAHAAVLAERLFGKPVQVEFADANILQVRPIPNYQPRSTEYAFLADREPITWTRAIGFGDLTLKILSAHDDNQDEVGVVIFHSENRFTTGLDNAGYAAMPAEGAVIILHNDGHSGHAQMLAQEQGLLCLFPDTGKTLSRLEDMYYARFRGRTSNESLRLITDGFTGAIYESDEDVERRQKLLRRIAGNLTSLVEVKSHEK